MYCVMLSILLLHMQEDLPPDAVEEPPVSTTPEQTTVPE